MYGLYDKEGILRFVDTDKDACVAYAELFELSSTNYCLMDLADDTKKIRSTNLDQSLGVNNNKIHLYKFFHYPSPNSKVLLYFLNLFL